MGRDVRDGRRPPPGRPHAARRPASPAGRRVRVALRRPGPRVPGSGHHLPVVGGGTALPTRPRTSHHRRAGVGGTGVRGCPAGESAGSVSGRRLRAVRDPQRWGGSPAPGDHVRALPPGGLRHRTAQRRADPRGRRRRGPWRGRPVLRVGGQHPVPLGHLLRHREPADDGPHLPRAVRQPSGAARQRATPPSCWRRLRAAAPSGVNDPTVVVLTPGVYNSAYFEHSFLARQMGVELVEGRDLVCRGGLGVHAHVAAASSGSTWSTGASTTSSSIPLHFRPDSIVGCPGILNAARAGNVTIANAVGNGVADDKLTYTYVPEIIRYYLGEEPILPNVTPTGWRTLTSWRTCWSTLTSWCSSRSAARAATASSSAPRRPTRSWPPPGPPCRPTPVPGSPRRWCRSPPRPTSAGDRLAPRHLDLRPFAVNDGAADLGRPRRADPGGPAAKAAWSSTPARAAAPRTPGSPSATARSARLAVAAGRRCRPAVPSRPRRHAGPPARARPGPRRRHPPAQQQQQQQQQRPAGGPAGAEPDRREPLLDRPLHRAGRGHRPHPRRPHPPPAGSARQQRSRDVPVAAGHHGHVPDARAGSRLAAIGPRSGRRPDATGHRDAGVRRGRTPAPSSRRLRRGPGQRPRA